MSDTRRVPACTPARFALAATLFLFATTVTAASVDFFDGSFADGDWEATKIVDTTAGATASFSATRIPAGGNPDAYRQVTHVYDAGNIFVGHLSLGATYDPSASGAILSLGYGYDLIHINPPVSQAVGYAIAIFQDGNWYSSNPVDVVFPQAWTTFGASGLTAASFVRRAGTGPATPDFSGLGGPLTFGYLSLNSNTGGAPGLTRVSGIDNWHVELTTVPLPPAAALFATALAATLARRRRREN